MSTLDESINSLGIEELIALQSKIEERINKLRRTEKNAAKKKILELANAYGIDLSFTEQEAVSKPKKPAKYKDPKNPEQTWNGHGKKPAWLESLIAQGHKPEEFLIQA
jgi:DNA-binding protein H-NS